MNKTFPNKLNQNQRFRIKLSYGVLQFFDCECYKANKVEIGGILIGYYSKGCSIAIITEATKPPKDSTSGFSWFYRGIDGLKKLLLDRWINSENRTFYLGEWHYHPHGSVNPSTTDINQMNKISKSKNYYCKEPILIIIGEKTAKSRQLRAFVFPQNKDFQEANIAYF